MSEAPGLKARFETPGLATPGPATPGLATPGPIAGLLPLDDRSRDEGRVALAFLAYSAVRPCGLVEPQPGHE